ncbi:VirB4 family type IV secretion system protein [Bryobacter aggregatus]|uniref:TraG/VirB4 family ATPase n=1 Tax=Bryobacter aggregatus TaxID=360054 RepID=UPI0004E20075|nr:VirB4 family type IV secretion system protein [Bryobacter aggregatus]
MPVTAAKHEESLRRPALCELLPVREYLDGVMVQVDGSLVAGYELTGINGFYHDDSMRNRSKHALEALIRSLPERSMRLQMRFEICEGIGDARTAYPRLNRNENAVLQAIDRERMGRWDSGESRGHYLRHLLHAYFVWNPRIHHELAEQLQGKKRSLFSLSVEKCVERARREHVDLLSEFGSLLAGVEQTLVATGMGVRRMSDDEMFLDAKRALNPAVEDRSPMRRADYALQYRSARSQVANTSIEDEQENYIQVGGLLYTLVSLKDLPDGTFPGILRELMVLDFPIIVNAEVTIPDQAKILEHFKGRLRRMQAAQRDSNGGFKVNVEAQVAQNQLQEVLQAVISSSLKVCNYSLVIAIRTSKPIVSRADMDEAQRTLNDRRQRVIHAVTRMNGARAIPESLTQRRLLIGTLPGMAQENKRDLSCLTLHAADLLPVEMPWQGTPQSPLMLLETPYRQLIPFSPYDPSVGDANMLFMAKSGGGKTFMAQMFLLMMARANPLISIVERGDSYRPLVEVMGGRVIEVDLEGTETLNPWDLPAGQTQPTKDKIAFLKNLTRHMIGDLGQTDTSILDNILSEAIARVYKRAAVRVDNKTPTYLDLRNELSTWTDEERIDHIRELALLASVALRQWTGDKGVYSKLFDRHTTIRTDANWLFFNIEGLSSDPRLETAMSMLIAQAMSERASGRSGQPSITVLDECWSLLESPVLADCVVQLFRTARKRGASVWGISQTLEDFVGTKQRPKEHGAGILRNTSVKVIGQQPGDVNPLVDHLALNEVALSEIKRFAAPRKGRSAEVLLVLGEKSETTQTIRLVPTPIDYWIATTYPRERAYRSYFLGLDRNRKRSLIEVYRELGERFPNGLADIDALPEELSGSVQQAASVKPRVEAAAASGGHNA